MIRSNSGVEASEALGATQVWEGRVEEGCEAIIAESPV
jgi:hypothetical protein